MTAPPTPPESRPGSDGPAPPGPNECGRQLRGHLEAVLLIADEPVAVERLAAALGEPVDGVADLLVELAREYEAAGRGFRLRRVAGGWRLYTAAESAAVVERFVVDGQHARLSTAALETLAVIAYLQPVTRGRVAAVRGVSADGVIRTLLGRRLIAESGVDAVSGATLFVTTADFLIKLGLDTLDDLPPLAPLLPELDEVLGPLRDSTAGPGVSASTMGLS